MARVLVIDDDTDLLTLHSEVLKNDGQDVYTAQSAEEGLRLWEEVAPDCVLLDLLMTDMDGLEALKEFTARDPHTAGHHLHGVPQRGERHRGFAARRRSTSLTKGCTLEEIVTNHTPCGGDLGSSRRRTRTSCARFARRTRISSVRFRKPPRSSARNNEFNQSLLEGIDSGFLAAADDERILFANRSALRMLDLHEDGHYGQDAGRLRLSDGTRADDEAERHAAPGSGDALGRAEHRGEADTAVAAAVEVRVLRTVESSPSVIPSPSRNPWERRRAPGPARATSCCSATCPEMEELRLHMQRLEKLETLNIIIAGVAHEIKNPVAGIKGVASLLLEIMTRTTRSASTSSGSSTRRSA